jgi:dienelactone hydrolase
MLKRVAAFALFAAVLAAGVEGATAQAVERQTTGSGPAAIQLVDSMTVTYAGRGDNAPTLTAQFHRPVPRDPSVRVPAIVALHGCGGNTLKSGATVARTIDWTNRWLAAGYAVVWPDSFGSRGLGPQCTASNRSIFPRQRALDAAASADWLAAQPGIDKDRLALVGWSHGGSTVLHTIRGGFSLGVPAGIDFKTAIAFYPGCRVLLQASGTTAKPWSARLPLALLIGGADDWTPAAPCRELGQRASVRYIEYPGAYHDFDAPNVPLRLRTGLTYSADGSGRAHIGTDPAARAAAILEVTETLRAAFK